VASTGEQQQSDWGNEDDEGHESMDIFEVRPIAAGPVNAEEVGHVEAFYATEAEARAVAQVRNFRSPLSRMFHVAPELYTTPFAWFVVLIAGTGEFVAHSFTGGESPWYDVDFIVGIFPNEAMARAYAADLASGALEPKPDAS